MSDLRARLDSDLAAAGLAPLHRLGQNFMIDGGALDRLVSELAVAPGTRVVEIGPGTGLLTERLIAAGAEVLAVEIDRGLAALLQRTLVPRGLCLVHGDALESKTRLHPAIEAFARRPWRLGANLPYDIAVPALLDAAVLGPPALPPELAVVTVQYEAAQRLCAAPGTDAWGASAAVLQAAGEPVIVRRLAATSFHPRPRVESAMLRWRPHPEADRARLAGFSAWCRRAFSARRKVLVRALRDTGMERERAEAACRACGFDGLRRLESLSAAELVALHARIQESI